MSHNELECLVLRLELLAEDTEPKVTDAGLTLQDSIIFGQSGQSVIAKKL